MKTTPRRALLTAGATVIVLIAAAVTYLTVPSAIAQTRAQDLCNHVRSTDTVDTVLAAASAAHKPDRILNFAGQGLSLAWNGSGTERWTCEIAFENGKVASTQVVFKD